jgi:hypothetical protein
MRESNKTTNHLTDEEVLREFVKRFQCDGAVLIYLDSNTEFGFARWRNSLGRKWANNLFKALKEDAVIDFNDSKKIKVGKMQLLLQN